MHRRILSISIITLTLALVLGLMDSLRLSAEATLSSSALATEPLNVAGAGFEVAPQTQGGFAQAGSTSVFTVEVKNLGSLPADTFEIDVTSTWPVMLYNSNDLTPLTDTNGNGSVDTGIVADGQAYLIRTEVETPSTAVVGDAHETLLNVRSSVSPTMSVTAVLQNAVPGAFAQTLYERSNRAMSLIMAGPDGEWRPQVTNEDWYGGSDPFFPDLAVSETASGYVYVWSNQRYINDIWREEIEYRLTDKRGDGIQAIRKLTNHNLVSTATYDSAPAVAVAPSGQIGVTWYRKIVEEDGSQNYNVFLAILDHNGQPVTDTINLTNNVGWRPDLDVPAFNSPRIAATSDGRFAVAWASSVEVSYTEQTTNLDDIYFAIYDSDGKSVTETINVSNNTPGSDYKGLEPALAAVGADRVFLSWAQRRPAVQGGNTIMYTVFDSEGATRQATTALTNDADYNDWSNYDIMQLSNGNIIVAWQAYGCDRDNYGWTPRIRYTVLKNNNYNPLGQPKCLPATVVAQLGDEGASLIADDQGRAILTWTDADEDTRRRLYYALLGANGNPITDPMIFYSSPSAEPLISTGLHGNASGPRNYLDATIGFQPAIAPSNGNNRADLTINYQNLGTLPGAGVVVTLTLSPSLSLTQQTAPFEPNVFGQNIVWNFDELLPSYAYAFDVELSIAEEAVLHGRYPITATIAVDGQDINLANNSAQGAVVSWNSVFLPAVVSPD